MRRNVHFAAAGLVAFSSLVNALNTIKVEGQDFVDSVTGDRFEILGVDYQPGGESGYNPKSGIDPFSNATDCLRDAAMMQAIGFNTIRTYNVDPKINHDECMSIFNAVGIYLILDVNSPLAGDSINRDEPESSYNAKYLERIFQVVDAFSGYPNTIGFFGANELINTWPTANQDAVYIRAVTRDLKQYIAKQAKRTLPVGYSAADFRPALVDTTNYLQCEINGDPDSRSDFFALNSYSWCGRTATYHSSQYDQLAADFAEIAMPSFYSEYGCIVPSPRYFNEVPVLYGPKMTALSGGLVYQWTEEGDGYGLVHVKNDASLQTTVDLQHLIEKYYTLNPKFLLAQNTTARNLKPPTCSASLIKHSQWKPDFKIPSAPSGTSEMIEKGAGGRVGKIVKVTQTAVQVVVTSADGSKTTGLTITPVTTANLPGKSAPGSSENSNGSSSGSGQNAAAPGKARSISRNPAPYVGFSLASFILWILG